MNNLTQGHPPAAIALFFGSNALLMVGLNNESAKKVCLGMAIVLFAAASVIWVLKK